MSLSNTRSGWSTDYNAKWQEQNCRQPKKPVPTFNKQEISVWNLNFKNDLNELIYKMGTCSPMSKTKLPKGKRGRGYKLDFEMKHTHTTINIYKPTRTYYTAQGTLLNIL